MGSSDLQLPMVFVGTSHGLLMLSHHHKVTLRHTIGDGNVMIAREKQYLVTKREISLLIPNVIEKLSM